ncbi:discoidin domain-containing protein [Dickeya fangzhongdai]|uniref:discoidin domain-containing protein n=1 Tax=Dickeya fangzhongdai TaxID=1778540 RepID=UPI001EFAE6C8|nr:discoidin domain-containing protein [Dickeya fangzhongdai]ULR32800.1 discoidin domain-containing protein [Dickeya fangzhongdai]
MWYKSGSLSLFSGSKVVLGNNTIWTDKNNGVIADGMLLIFADCSIKIYEIASVVSDTELVLASEYSGCTANGVHYAIPAFGSSDTFDHAAYVAQVAAMLAGYQSQLTQWKQVLTERGQVTLTDSNGQNVVVKTLPDLTDAVSRMMDKTLNGADIPDKAQFVANLGLSDVVHKADLANHTHTASQITDFTDAVRKVLVATLAAGRGVSLAYDNRNNQLTINATGTGSDSGQGGRGYTVSNQQGATTGQVFSFPISTDSQWDYSAEAYALKEEAGLSNQTVVLESFDATSRNDYQQTSALVWDGTVKPYSGETYAVAADGDYYSREIKADGKSIQISSISYATPVMAANTSADGYVASASSVYDTSVFAWMAFNRKVGGYYDNNKAWFSAKNNWPAWLRIDFPQPYAVTEYEIGVRNDGYPSNPAHDSARPTNFSLQGSNDGSTWTDLDVQSNVTWQTLPQVKTFKIGTPAAYSKYRLYITSSDGDGIIVGISMLNLYRTSNVLLRAGNEYFNVVNHVLVPVNAPTSKGDFASGFRESGIIDASQLNGKLPLTVVTPEQTPITTSYLPYSQIMVSKARYNLSSFKKVNAITASYTAKGNGKLRGAVSHDGRDWYIWNGTQWENIGQLTVDTSGATTLLAKGMPLDVMNKIDSVAWSTWIAPSADGITDSVFIAYAFDITDTSNDTASLDSLNLNVDYVSAWKKQTEAEVEIRWYPDKVTFKTVAAGNYKLAYQQP